MGTIWDEYEGLVAERPLWLEAPIKREIGKKHSGQRKKPWAEVAIGDSVLIQPTQTLLDG